MTNSTLVNVKLSEIASETVSETIAPKSKPATSGPRAETLALIRLFARMYSPDGKPNIKVYLA